jgi:hypothetical protein
MPLTRAEQRLKREVQEVAALTKTDSWDIESYGPEARKTILQLTIHTLVIGEVVSKYTLVDEMLTMIICDFLFRRRQEPTYRRLWRTKRFKLFVHYMTDEIFVLQKMRMVHAIKPLPKDVRTKIEGINALRNALAHSFFPENRRQYEKQKKVIYAGINIRSANGLRAFQADFDTIWDSLAKRAYGVG